MPDGRGRALAGGVASGGWPPGQPGGGRGAAPRRARGWQRPRGIAGIRRLCITLVTVAALIQLVFWGGEPDNAPTVLLAWFASAIGILWSLDDRRFAFAPLGSTMVFFFNATSISGAILVKTMEHTALSERLTVPVQTFAVLFGAQLAIIAGHAVYLNSGPLQRMRRWLVNRVTRPIGLFDWPTDLQLWTMGLLGCAALVGGGGADYESAASFGSAVAGKKILIALQFLKYAPFLIPMRPALAGSGLAELRAPRRRVPMLELALYFCALVGLSFATNSRSTFADAIPTIAIGLLFAIGIGRMHLSDIPKGPLLLWGMVGLVAAVLLPRVALAMVVVRDYRSSLDAVQLIGMTIEALFNSEWLAVARSKMEAAVNVGNYSETYVDSRFFARFLLTKFHDNLLYYFGMFGDDATAEYARFLTDRALATFPDPVLRMLHLSIDKEALVFSNGDYVIYLVDGWGLGGYKTGSMMAEFFAIFGWLGYLPALAVGSVMLFVAYESLVAVTRDRGMVFSPLLLLLIWNLVGTTAAFGFGSESIVQIPAGILRGLTQYVLLWLVAKAAVGFVVRR